jgi:hypothetical protein
MSSDSRAKSRSRLWRPSLRIASFQQIGITLNRTVCQWSTSDGKSQQTLPSKCPEYLNRLAPCPAMSRWAWRLIWFANLWELIPRGPCAGMSGRMPVYGGLELCCPACVPVTTYRGYFHRLQFVDDEMAQMWVSFRHHYPSRLAQSKFVKPLFSRMTNTNAERCAVMSLLFNPNHESSCLQKGQFGRQESSPKYLEASNIYQVGSWQFSLFNQSRWNHEAKRGRTRSQLDPQPPYPLSCDNSQNPVQTP